MNGPTGAWSLLRSVADWDRYRGAVSEANQIDLLSVNWGQGPQTFPCLAASYAVSKSQVIGCYVYLTDAVGLLQAGGNFIPVAKVMEAGSAQQSMLEQHQLVTALSAISARLDRSNEFEKSVIAHILTSASLMIDTSIVKPAGYEERYVRFLADVDQVEISDRGNMVNVKDLLDRLGGKSVE